MDGHACPPGRVRRSPPERLIRMGTVMFAIGLLFVTAEAIAELAWAPWKFHDLMSPLSKNMEWFTTFVLLVYPILFMGLSMAALQTCRLIADTYSKSGYRHQVIVVKWCLRIFSWGFLIFTADLFGSATFERFRNVFAHVRTEQADMIFIPLTLGGAGTSIVGFILSLIVLIQFSGRMKKLAKTVEMTNGALTGPGGATSSLPAFPADISPVENRALS